MVLFVPSYEPKIFGIDMRGDAAQCAHAEQLYSTYCNYTFKIIPFKIFTKINAVHDRDYIEVV